MLSCTSYIADMLLLTLPLLRQLQPLQYEARVTTQRSSAFILQLCWDTPCSVAIFALRGKAEKPAKAQSLSSSEEMHVYKKQGLSYSPHCFSVTLPVKNKNWSFPFLMSNHGLAHQLSAFKWASVPFQGNDSVLALPAGLLLSFPSVCLA